MLTKIYQGRNIRNKILQPILGTYSVILISKHFHAYSVLEGWIFKDTLCSYTFLKRIKRASKWLSLNLILRFWRIGENLIFFWVCRLQLYFKINAIEMSWDVPEKIYLRMYMLQVFRIDILVYHKLIQGQMCEAPIKIYNKNFQIIPNHYTILDIMVSF